LLARAEAADYSNFAEGLKVAGYQKKQVMSMLVSDGRKGKESSQEQGHFAENI